LDIIKRHKIMGKLKTFFAKMGQHWYVKYLVVVVVGVLIVGVLDENSLWAHYRNTERIKVLKEEIAFYQQNYERDLAKIKQMQQDPKAIERVARERYFMKTDDEDVFVLSDDDTNRHPTMTTGYEAAE